MHRIDKAFARNTVIHNDDGKSEHKLHKRMILSKSHTQTCSLAHRDMQGCKSTEQYAVYTMTYTSLRTEFTAVTSKSSTALTHS